MEGISRSWRRRSTGGFTDRGAWHRQMSKSLLHLDSGRNRLIGIGMVSARYSSSPSSTPAPSGWCRACRCCRWSSCGSSAHTVFTAAVMVPRSRLNLVRTPAALAATVAGHDAALHDGDELLGVAVPAAGGDRRHHVPRARSSWRCWACTCSVNVSTGAGGSRSSSASSASSSSCSRAAADSTRRCWSRFCRRHVCLFHPADPLPGVDRPAREHQFPVRARARRS